MWTEGPSLCSLHQTHGGAVMPLSSPAVKMGVLSSEPDLAGGHVWRRRQGQETGAGL